MIGLLLAALPGAHACSCDLVLPREGFPLDGEVGVPLDASVLLRISSWEEDIARDYTLRDLASGEDVPVATTRAEEGDGFALILTPEAPLAPQTPHSLLESEAYPDRTFTTGTELAAPVEDAPSLTVEDAVSIWVPTHCGPERFARLAITGDAAWWELEVSVNGGPPSTWPVADPSPIVGDTGCFESVPVRRGDKVAVRARGVNAAGAPGPWSDVVEARLCGCDGAGVGPGLAWLVGVGILARRRRR